jgi:hypothetical protein
MHVSDAITCSMSALLGWMGVVGVCVAAPSIFYASDPVGPDETVLVTGAGFEEIDSIFVQRVRDDADASSPLIRVDPVQPSSTSVKFTIPPLVASGVYRYTITTRDGSVSGILNAPTVFWSQGDRGSCATPGGVLRTLGRNIARNENATLSLLTSDGAIVAALRPQRYTMWDASFSLPASLGVGVYGLRLQNGQGAAFGAVDAGTFEICRSPTRSDVSIDAKSFGAQGDGLADDTAAIARALSEAGKSGGDVRLPRGRYRLSNALHIPAGVILHGERRDLVALIWNDFETPPPALVEGAGDFTLEDMTLYASKHLHVVDGGCAPQPKDGGRVRLHRVTIRASAYRGHISAADANRVQQTLYQATGTGADTLRLCGADIEVTDSDLYGSSRAFELLAPRNAYIARNKFYNGRGGWYAVHGGDGVIFEGNVVSGVDVTASGGGVSPIRTSLASSNVLFYANTFERMYGWDREAVTTDGPGGFYYGAVAPIGNGTIAIASPSAAAATPGSISFADAPSWAGATLFVLGGRGAGQFATVRARDGERIIPDKPLQIEPDLSSIVTIVPARTRHLYIDNYFSDVGIAVQLYGTALESYVVGNVSERSGGFVDWALWYHHVQASWGTQFLDNRILDGNVYRGGSNAATEAGDSILGAFVAPWRHNRTPLIRGTIIRGNRLEGNAHIEINGRSTDFASVKDVIVEANSIEHADVGIVLHGLLEGVYQRKNAFVDVRRSEVSR